MEEVMGKPRAIRNRKNEMISCWVCTFVLVLVYLAKTVFIGNTTVGTLDVVLWLLTGIWFCISVFYTVQFVRKRERKQGGNGSR